MALTNSLAGRNLGMLLLGIWLILTAPPATAQRTNLVYVHDRVSSASHTRRYTDPAPSLALLVRLSLAGSCPIWIKTS